MMQRYTNTRPTPLYPDDNGEWCRWDDFKQLTSQRIEELKAESIRLKEEYYVVDGRNIDLQNSNKDLKQLIREWAKYSPHALCRCEACNAMRNKIIEWMQGNPTSEGE